MKTRDDIKNSHKPLIITYIYVVLMSICIYIVTLLYIFIKIIYILSKPNKNQPHIHRRKCPVKMQSIKYIGSVQSKYNCHPVGQINI